MGAFSIAFDIIIVGALALSWVLLVIHLFFSSNVCRVKSLLHWVVKQNQPAVAGVLLFAMTYALGSVVSRIAQDFFDDDDLHIHVLNHLYRVGVTESSIRTDVYCGTLKREPAPKPGNPPTANPQPADPAAGKPNPPENPDCRYAGTWIVPTRDPETYQRITAEWINDQQDSARYIFAVHEAALLLKGN